jgi:glycosyltransferase involved in cell wall biosynthesis
MTAPLIRVAHVSLGLETGGQEKLLVEFARHADRARFHLTMVSLSGRGRLAETLEELGCEVVALDEPAGLRPGLLLRLASLFRKRRFDVVHTHDDKPLLYALPAAWLSRVPRRIHTHHHGAVPYIGRRQLKLLAAASKLADRFVCVSHDSAKYMVSQGVPASRVQTLWNGIDLERFAPRGPDPIGPVVTVARLSPEKDVENLLRAVALADKLRAEIAGDGPCRDALHTLAQELGIVDRVRFLGEVHDVAALLARARLFALPSRTEGISLTILEAMARGLPVVTTRVGGNPEVVVEGETGLLVPPLDPAALAAALRRVWEDTALGQSLGDAGRRRVEAHFDIRRMVAAYEALYVP